MKYHGSRCTCHTYSIIYFYQFRGSEFLKKKTIKHIVLSRFLIQISVKSGSMDNEGMLRLTGETSPRLTLSFNMPLDANTYKNNYLKNGYVNDKKKYTKKKINQYNCEFNLNADSKMRFSGAPLSICCCQPWNAIRNK